MYFAVKAWVFERGGRLVYLGGNGIDCEVELVAEGSAGITQRRPELCVTTRASRAARARSPAPLRARRENEAGDAAGRLARR